MDSAAFDSEFITLLGIILALCLCCLLIDYGVDDHFGLSPEPDFLEMQIEPYSLSLGVQYTEYLNFLVLEQILMN